MIARSRIADNKLSRTLVLVSVVVVRARFKAP